MIWLQQKYISLLSNRLKKFKQKNNSLYNFSCPLCNELKKSRGYFYEKNNRFIFHCHNCGSHKTFNDFLKDYDCGLYDEYVFEIINEKNLDKSKNKSNTEKKKIELKKNPLSVLKKISQLSINHPCKKYVIERRIPSNIHYKLYWCDSFKKWINNYYSDKFKNDNIDEGRFVIPFYDKKGKLFAVQGRSLKKNTNCKYITIIFDENLPKIYGLDTIDDNKKYYIFEGPIDSFYIKNSVATAGGDLTSAIKTLNQNNAVIVYDNEKRNIETINKIHKAINMNLQVCIWPKDLRFKDVSEMIMNGMNNEDVKKIIDNNTYCGLAARLELEFWSQR